MVPGNNCPKCSNSYQEISSLQARIKQLEDRESASKRLSWKDAKRKVNMILGEIKDKDAQNYLVEKILSTLGFKKGDADEK